MHDKYDVLIIGGGPGVCCRHPCRPARASYRIGGKTASGGICLNWGCIPTKALLHGAEVAHSIAHADRLGISLGEVSFDLQKLVQFSRAVSQQLTGGVEYLLKKNGVRSLMAPPGCAVRANHGRRSQGRARLSGRSCDPATGAATSVARHRARWRIYLDLFRGPAA
jgi:pyruvate/2-oxoglutarate dehydrogenase complex dihydrolipoamide dehydrogenase (E3) component